MSIGYSHCVDQTLEFAEVTLRALEDMNFEK